MDRYSCRRIKFIESTLTTPIQTAAMFDVYIPVLNTSVDVERYKDRYTEVLKAYDLFEGEDDLHKLV